MTREPQIGKQLSIMERQQHLDRLDLYNDQPVYEQIDTIGRIQLFPSENDRQRKLPINPVSSSSDFICKTRVIGGLE